MLFTHPVGRAASFLLAVALSTVLLIVPHIAIQETGDVNHLSLFLLLFGIMIGFIHSVGFQLKKMTVWYFIFNPLLGWLLMLYYLVIALRVLL